jgi:tRNA dimethylallyltransferase
LSSLEDLVHQNWNDRILVVVGPTASGKTGLAVALARALGGEIVGADSVQVYRGFDIGSGKASPEELAGIAHHLIDVRDADDPLDAAQFVQLADAAIAAIRERGHVPIVCGGTYLWTKALLSGLAQAPPAPADMRQRWQQRAQQEGAPALHQRLREVDAETANRLHPNDATRIIRALEVHELTGTPLSVWQQRHGFRQARYDAQKIGILWPKQSLTARIEERIDSMLQRGWVSEVRSLVDRGFGHTRAMGAVGYREVFAHVSGSADEAKLRDAIVRSTRIFARRQRTWLAHENVLWVSPEDSHAFAQKIG